MRNVLKSKTGKPLPLFISLVEVGHRQMLGWSRSRVAIRVLLICSRCGSPLDVGHRQISPVVRGCHHFLSFVVRGSAVVKVSIFVEMKNGPKRGHGKCGFGIVFRRD